MDHSFFVGRKMTEENHIIENILPKQVLNFDFSTLMLFRCTRRDRAEQFVSGKIYMGCPQQWIDIEKSGNKGQGDILEGVFYSTKLGDEDKLIDAFKLDIANESFIYDGFLCFRKKSC
jgi:hypothetical protein